MPYSQERKETVILLDVSLEYLQAWIVFAGSQERMMEEWNEQLFNQELEFSENMKTVGPHIPWAVIILLSTICCCLFGGCS
jgi:hypothetical protein